MTNTGGRRLSCLFRWQVGKKNRATAATAMNQDSSRSHSIFTITVESSSSVAMQENFGVQQVLQMLDATYVCSVRPGQQEDGMSLYT